MNYQQYYNQQSTSAQPQYGPDTRQIPAHMMSAQQREKRGVTNMFQDLPDQMQPMGNYAGSQRPQQYAQGRQPSGIVPPQMPMYAPPMQPFQYGGANAQQQQQGGMGYGGYTRPLPGMNRYGMPRYGGGWWQRQQQQTNYMPY